MVKRTTVENWGFSCLGMEIDDSGEVVRIFCKTCREFFSQEKEKNAMLSKVKGSKKFINQSNAYIDGTAVVRKCNFEKHLTHKNHKTAALRLKEVLISKSAPAVSTTEEVSSSAVKQTVLHPMIQKISAAQRLQLGRKFQLARLTCANGNLFKLYENFGKFEKDYHGVDLGNGFLTDKAGMEIMKYISISQRIKNIMEPLNENILNYYSVLFDGASSSKCVNEKEPFAIKLCVEGKPIFHVMSLEKPEECNAEGIKESMDNAVSKMKFNFKRSENEIGMCSDGAMVNHSVYNLLRDEFGEQYLSILCLSHKFELSINDAFGSSVLSNNTEKDYIEIYYFFKKSPLRWRLFK